jgi:hypothetical protein
MVKSTAIANKTLKGLQAHSLAPVSTSARGNGGDARPIHNHRATSSVNWPRIANAIPGSTRRPNPRALGSESYPPTSEPVLSSKPHSQSSVSDSVKDFEIRIRQLWSRGSGHTLELAVAIRDARRKLRHGQWAVLFQSGRMPFSKRQADRLVGIARLGWLNGTSLSHLPRSWTSLHRLAQLDRPVLERLIEEGTVHPGLTLREVRELVARFNGRRRRARSDLPAVQRRVERFREFVLGGWESWTPQQRKWTRDELVQLVHKLETSNGLHPSQSQSEGDPS